MSKDIFDRVHGLIVKQRRLFWHIDVAVVFVYPNGDVERLGGDFQSWCTFSEVAPACTARDYRGIHHTQRGLERDENRLRALQIYRDFNYSTTFIIAHY